MFANNEGIDDPLDKKKKSACRDPFSGFIKNMAMSLVMKPEGFSRARAHGMNRKAVEDCFTVCQNLCTELNVQDKQQLNFNMDQTGFPLDYFSPKIFATKGTIEVLRFTSVEMGVTCCMLQCKRCLCSLLCDFQGG